MEGNLGNPLAECCMSKLYYNPLNCLQSIMDHSNVTMKARWILKMSPVKITNVKKYEKVSDGLPWHHFMEHQISDSKSDWIYFT